MAAATDYTAVIVNNLKALKLQEQQAREFFKVRAYNTALKAISEFNEPITSYEDAETIPGLGKGTLSKIKEIIEEGHLERTKDVIENTQHQIAIDTFTNIMAVGPIKAAKLVTEHKIYTIEALREAIANGQTDLLNDKQKIGLEYYEDFIKRIPRKEMDVHAALLQEVICRVAPDVTFEIAGSYRRRAADSGDIDVFFTLPEDHTNHADVFKAVVKELKRIKYIRGEFAFGPEKFMGISRLPRHRTSRRIDLMYIPREKYPFALLYFTGSKEFNIKMRNVALSKGLSLSEHGFKDLKTNALISLPHLTTEESVFEHLGMKWVAPWDR